MMSLKLVISTALNALNIFMYIDLMPLHMNYALKNESTRAREVA